MGHEMKTLYSKFLQLLLHKEVFIRLFVFGPLILAVFLFNLFFVSTTSAFLTPAYFLVGFLAADLIVFWINGATSLANHYRQILENKITETDSEPEQKKETVTKEVVTRSALKENKPTKLKQNRKSSIPAPALIVSDPPVKKKTPGRGRPKSTPTES